VQISARVLQGGESGVQETEGSHMMINYIRRSGRERNSMLQSQRKVSKEEFERLCLTFIAVNITDKRFALQTA
jgi:DNA gyrase/topoisomerase IV subunit B